MYLHLKFYFYSFYDRVLAFTAIPKYRDNVFDPDPEKSYTKAKLKRHLENDKENMIDNLLISSSAKNPEELFPTDEVANEVFNTNFSVLPNLQHIKNTGKSIKKYDNVDAVVNSNGKGLRMMRFVHDSQMYKDPQKKNMSLCERAVGPLTREIVNARLN